MAVILWVLGLSLLMQSCLCSLGQTDQGCMKWIPQGDNVCCEACHPGNRVVNRCGKNPKELCTLCEPGTFTMEPAEKRCSRCSQCVGALVLVKECTATTDTQCGCKKGLTCGDPACSFCVQTCGKGQEPTEQRFCRTCPDGTFNNQIHKMCKPWSTKCPNPDQYIEAKGNAFSDIKCSNGANISVSPVTKPDKPEEPEQAWPAVLSVFSIVLMTFGIIIIITVTTILYQKRKTIKKPKHKTPIIRTPTDDPMTLIAVECSFHEAQQEQGSSSESLASKDSSEQLIS